MLEMLEPGAACWGKLQAWQEGRKEEGKGGGEGVGRGEVVVLPKPFGALLILWSMMPDGALGFGIFPAGFWVFFDGVRLESMARGPIWLFMSVSICFIQL